MLMKLNRKIINQCISVLMLLIYLFGSSAILSFHDHHDHHAHHDQELLFCENFYQDSSYNSHCSHDSHIISLKERCAICDHFSNSEPVILDSKIKSSIELFSVNWSQLFVSLYLDDSTNTLNKSPPFII